jgi:hypothetical protein
MSRVLRAGTFKGPSAEVDRAPTRWWQFQDLPSGLASLVLHFTVLIILGLIVTETTRPHLSEVIVDWQEPGDPLGGGGGGNEGLDELDQPAELDPDWTQASNELAAALPELDAPLVETTALTASDWGNVAADLAPSAGASDALSDLAALGALDLRGPGSGGGTGGGRGRGNGPGIGNGTGPGSATSMFGLRDEGSRIVYVFDRSESMNSVFTLTDGDDSISVTSLQAAKDELTKSINGLSDGGEFQMIFYNDAPMPFLDHYNKDGLSRADAKTKDLATQFIYRLVAERNTNHVDAVLMALELKPDVIYLLTDGEAKDDPTSSDLRRIGKLARRSNTRINVIHFCYEERPNSSLVALAKRTQGQFKSIPIRSLVDPDWD